MVSAFQAADFLQHHGKTRTAAERKAELNDVDINNDGWISFLEYLCLHYKVLILTEFYKRYQLAPVEDLAGDGVGVCGVGFKLVDEVLTLPKGLNPQIEAAIEEFMEQKKAREAKVAALTAKAEAGGVKGLAAKQELVILESGDETATNRVELTLQVGGGLSLALSLSTPPCKLSLDSLLPLGGAAQGGQEPRLNGSGRPRRERSRGSRQEKDRSQGQNGRPAGHVRGRQVKRAHQNETPLEALFSPFKKSLNGAKKRDGRHQRRYEEGAPRPLCAPGASLKLGVQVNKNAPHSTRLNFR